MWSGAVWGELMKKSLYYLYEAQRSVQIHTVHGTDINHNRFLVR